MHSPGFVAATDEEAAERYWPYHKAVTDRSAASAAGRPSTSPQYQAGLSAGGSLYVGSPETVARKIARNMRILGVSRFDMRYATGRLPHEDMMRSIELYGTAVAPAGARAAGASPSPSRKGPTVDPCGSDVTLPGGPGARAPGGGTGSLTGSAG